MMNIKYTLTLTRNLKKKKKTSLLLLQFYQNFGVSSILQFLCNPHFQLITLQPTLLWKGKQLWDNFRSLHHKIKHSLASVLIHSNFPLFSRDALLCFYHQSLNFCTVVHPFSVYFKKLLSELLAISFPNLSYLHPFPLQRKAISSLTIHQALVTSKLSPKSDHFSHPLL